MTMYLHNGLLKQFIISDYVNLFVKLGWRPGHVSCF